MRKEFFLFSVILTILLFNFSLVGLSSVYAQTQLPTPPSELERRVPEASSGVLDTVNKIINFITYALLIVAVVVIVLAGYQFVTAQGDTEKITKARNYIIYAMIGVVVALLSQAIIGLVRNMIEK
jgi:Na+-driven multidrug efflux pump